MNKVNYLFLLLLLPFLLTACAGTCVRPMEFGLYGRVGEDDMMLPVEIKGVKTNITMRKANAAPAELHETSRLAQRLDEIEYRNCETLKDLTEKDKKRFKEDNAKYDSLLDDLIIALRSPADDYQKKLQSWIERSKEAVER